MNSVWPARIRPYSSAIGSLTFSTSSASAQTSSALGDDRGAGGGVLVVEQCESAAGAGLHQHLVAGAGQLADAGRSGGDPELFRLHLGRNADPHDLPFRHLLTTVYVLDYGMDHGNSRPGPLC